MTPEAGENPEKGIGSEGRTRTGDLTGMNRLL